MGNNKSELLEKKSSKNDFLCSEDYPIYELINSKGRGKLVDLMKTALKSNDFTQVDKLIKKEVPYFLINNGDGEMVGLNLSN